MIKNIKALLLAGGKTKHELKRVTNQEYKALMTINKMNSQPIIYHIVKILRGSRYISEIYVAGPEQVNNLIYPQVDAVIPSGQTLIDTLKNGIYKLQDEPYILITTSDIPLASSKHIDSFIKNCLISSGFDIYYSIINKETYTKFFPDSNLRRIYANLVEGSFTGGNIFMVNPRVIIDCAEVIEQFIIFRKHPLKMARILGKRFVIKYLKKYLSIRDLEKLVPHYLKSYTGKAILADPEIALDIDKPIHLEAIMRRQNG
ncbi:MAG: NTP transferase domain-containing protein [Arcobacteraceae bacterium]